MLAALEGCMEGEWSCSNGVPRLMLLGYKSLHQAGILQRNISQGNIMMNEDPTNPSWPAFLIDLDLGVRVHRQGPSGARGITGTRAFMAIGVLRGEKHSFMHDYESFFWVIFWICIHYNEPHEAGRAVPIFEKWNYAEMEELAKLKLGTVLDEDIFLETLKLNLTPYYTPLGPWINRLRRVVFPQGRLRKEEDESLASKMLKILQEAQIDPAVLSKPNTSGFAE